MSDFFDFMGDVMDTMYYLWLAGLVAVVLLSFILSLIFRTRNSLFILMLFGIMAGVAACIYQQSLFIGLTVSVASISVFSLALMFRGIRQKIRTPQKPS